MAQLLALGAALGAAGCQQETAKPAEAAKPAGPDTSELTTFKGPTVVKLLVRSDATVTEIQPGITVFPESTFIRIRVPPMVAKGADTRPVVEYYNPRGPDGKSVERQIEVIRQGDAGKPAG